MKTPDLIQKLAGELTPISPRKTRNDLLIGLGCGAGVTLICVILIYGVQPGLFSFSHGLPLLMKAAYALSLAAIAASMLVPMLKPGSPVPARRRWLATTLLLIAALALFQTVTAANIDTRSLWLGASWQQCPLRIACLSIPVLAGACWAVRRQAPVQLRTAGALAGLVAGGIATCIYALACPENGAGFVLVWYSLGIGITTVFGSIVGPRVLRW
ncbi:NrsF family protein [Rhizobium tumorigenes]|uniref:DUF1109 domain-containing protein n=1 Tax=Rhizobium tumorigenes TaxID=2041385 RepID=A0AAF1KSZ0_9HYPH|nr:DUF1109 domain-containing protein [Rhizobium tumorigenes]WFR98622.1 DUF1109 domain-containing protein [Rhizobium tumorigenes]